MRRIYLGITFLLLLITGCKKKDIDKTPYEKDLEKNVGVISAIVNNENNWNSKTLRIKEFNYVDNRFDLTGSMYGLDEFNTEGLAINCIDLNKNGKQKIYARQHWVIVDSVAKQRFDDSCMAHHGVLEHDAVAQDYYTTDETDNWLRILEYNPQDGSFAGEFELTLYRSKKHAKTAEWPDTLHFTQGRFFVQPNEVSKQ